MKQFILFAMTLLLTSNSIAGAVEFIVDGLKYSIISSKYKTSSLVTRGNYYELTSITIIDTETYANVTCCVTQIGNFMLNGCNGRTYSLYDLNGDGSVNAGDVGALYKIILGQ